MHFHSSGEVRIKTGINAAAVHRTKETIRVFDLNDAALRDLRRSAVSSYKKRVLPDFQEVETWPDDQQQAYLTVQIDATW